MALHHRKTLTATGQILCIARLTRNSSIDQCERLAEVVLHEGDHAHQKVRIGVTGLELEDSRAAVVRFAQLTSIERLLSVSMELDDL